MDQYAPVNQKAYEGPEKKNRIFFYGDPSITVRYDDYIKLPTMEEYISEVTPQVTIRSANERSGWSYRATIRIWNSMHHFS